MLFVHAVHNCDSNLPKIPRIVALLPMLLAVCQLPCEWELSRAIFCQSRLLVPARCKTCYLLCACLSIIASGLHC